MDLRTLGGAMAPPAADALMILKRFDEVFVTNFREFLMTATHT